ncbi:MAG: uracil-DNA glycosylase [Planctomycetota bacterium]|nr:uracil-DNA glycosylase [Planctomycetota bacterium]
MAEPARGPRTALAPTGPWRDVLAEVLASESHARLAAVRAAARAAGHEARPPAAAVFAALERVPPAAVRVVVVGQDPSPTPGHAHGLAFSYRGTGALPRSLRNILTEIETETGQAPSQGTGDLTPWADQGVLLLNTVLTVRAGEAGSHRRKGWEALTDAVLTHLAGQPRRLVFLLWGRDARKKAALLGTRHVVLEAGHPSPLSIRHFRGCGHFTATNDAIEGAPIDWRLG